MARQSPPPRHEHRLKIRERARGDTHVPVDISHADPAPSPPAPRFTLPLCVTFEYRGRPVICTPIHDDAGTIQNLLWACPRCGHPQQFGFSKVRVWVSGTGRVHALGVVRCARRGCPLLVDITDGQAVDVADWC